VLDTLEARVRRKLAGPSHPVWVSLADRLEAPRQAKLQTAAASVEFLKQLLELARALVEAENRDADGTLDAMSVLPDPHKGALTQILQEYAPEHTPALIENVVERIDAIVRPVRGTSWQTSQPGDRAVRRELRLVLSNNGLPAVGELHDRAYAYIREHY
jgi:type I restriction enzyme, R subunit